MKYYQFLCYWREISKWFFFHGLWWMRKLKREGQSWWGKHSSYRSILRPAFQYWPACRRHSHFKCYHCDLAFPTLTLKNHSFPIFTDLQIMLPVWSCISNQLWLWRSSCFQFWPKLSTPTLVSSTLRLESKMFRSLVFVLRGIFTAEGKYPSSR